MAIVEVESREKIAVLKLNRGVTNPVNLELVNQLARRLSKMREDVNISGIVLTSSNDKFFSIGFDIPDLFDHSKEEFRLFYHSFNQLCMDLYTFPKPIIAAITGHAIAAGCILALCCDYRLIAEGRKLMGLNEIKLGVPVPYPADCILRQLVGSRIAREMLDGGDFYEPQALLRMGMVDEIFPLEKVLDEALEKTGRLASLPPRAFQMIKRNRVETLEKHIKKYLMEKEEIFIDCWYSVEARQRLKEAMKKF